MKREILVSASPQESWVALMEDDRLVELMYDRPDQSRLVGDIFLGHVEAVLPGIQAAFVNIGTEKAGFLHASDLDYDEDSAAETDMNVVMSDAGNFIEVQGTAEGHPYSKDELNRMLDLAEKGITELFSAQQAAIED